ncbi:unnamed protein product, partial [Protopolystoma xenopodis]
AEEIDERDVLYKSVQLEVRGHDPAVLSSYRSFFTTACTNLSIDHQTEVRNRPIFDRFSFNRSVFIYKKHQRQYEFRTHVHYWTIFKVTGCTADVLLEYVQRFIPEGVGMIVTRV